MSGTAQVTTRVHASRTVGMAVAVALGLTGCTGPTGTDSSVSSAEDVADVRDEVARLEDQLARLEDQLAGFEDRVGDLEEPTVDGDPDEPEVEPDPTAVGDTFFDDPASGLGEEVTVRGEIAGFIATTDVASAFRIGGESGEPVAVISATPPPEIARGDVVEVSGTAVEVDPDTFEADFGVAADALFDRPGTWLDGAEGQVAIAAVRIEPVLSPAGG